MDLRFYEKDYKGYYGSVSETLQNAGDGRLKESENQISKFENSSVKSDAELDCGRSTLNIYNVGYVVKEWVGPWWKGACLRKVKKKTVLRNISLQVKEGKMTAILGNSGSGKTSLLDVIACRSTGEVTGTVSVDGVPCTRDVIQQRATYVMQADRLLPNLTVRETLRYTAMLKLPGNIKAQDVDRKVSQVILEMGLKDVADSRIGSSIIRGISGGEQRRVTIAIQLLKDPDMILLDEPTSGLDSYTARYLVSNLRDLARRGKIVLLTIHQPNSDIFHMFDQIGIMSQGEMVYCGPSKELVPYFTTLGYPCDKYTNPLDRYVDVASIDRRNKEKEYNSKKRVDSLVEAFNNSKLHHTTVQTIQKIHQQPRPKVNVRQKGPHYGRIILTLLSRMNKNLFRDRKDYFARIFLLPLFMVFIIIFLGRLGHTYKSIQDRIGLIYNATTGPPFMGIINSVALFVCLRDLYYRECRDGLYGTGTFLVAYSIHVIPLQILSTLIFSSIIYWVTGMNPNFDRFVLFTLEVFILHYWGEMVTVACMGLVMNPNLANSLAALVQSAAVIIASGYVKTVANLIEPFQWLSWILIHKYSGEIFIANEFDGLEFECDGFNPCIPNGTAFIQEYYPGADERVARNFGALGGYAVGTLILAILAFKIGGLRNLH